MSSTLSTLTARSLLGPLSTTFTPPPFCAQYWDTWGLGLEPTQIVLANHKACNSSVVDTSSCWPSVTPPFWATWTSARIGFIDRDFEGLGFYSPGYQCPSGHATACTATSVLVGEVQPSISATFDFQFALTAGEVAFGCCPS